MNVIKSTAVGFLVCLAFGILLGIGYLGAVSVTISQSWLAVGNGVCLAIVVATFGFLCYHVGEAIRKES